MPKRIKAPFYTETKTSLKSFYEDTRLPNGYLYSRGEYKTKITADDLPEYYVQGWIFKVQGYISVFGIKDIAYYANYHVNHLHRDDHLYVSFNKPITQEVDERGHIWYHGYDAVLWGHMIVDYIRAIRKFKSYEIEPIALQVRKKERFFREKYLEECKSPGIDWLERK